MCRKLQKSMQYITDQEKGGFYQHGYLWSKTGETVLEVIQSNHLYVQDPSSKSTGKYNSTPPDQVQSDLTMNMVMWWCKNSWSGMCQGGGTDELIQQHQIMRFREVIADLRFVVTYFA